MTTTRASPRGAYRGQPLVVLIALVVGWVAMRIAVLDAAASNGPVVVRHAAAIHARTNEAMHDPGVLAAPTVLPAVATSVAPVATIAGRSWRASLPLPAMPAPSRSGPQPPPPPVEAPPRVVMEHQLLGLAALTRLPLPPLALAAAAPAIPARRTRRDARWSADGWVLLRSGGEAAPVAGLAPATYGASQAGAVVRYRLAPESRHRLAAYLRASAALDGARDREAAAGLSARPIAGLPLVAAAEVRMNDQQAGTSLRPAAFVYTELPPFSLPLHAHGEFYGQAGYVGGNFATAFADGQLRVERKVLGLGRNELRAGGGAWGGAQKGAARIDVGPTATLAVPIGGSASARIALDWRFRVAGNAAPASGPALTLSAGF